MRPIKLALAVLVSVAVVASPSAARAADTLPLATPTTFAGLTAPNSIWSAPIASGAALDATSGALVSRLNGMVAADVAAGRGPWIDTNRCAAPIYRVPAGQPLVKVTLPNPTSIGQASLQAAFAAVPLPSNATPSKCSDATLMLWQPSTNRYWEFWRLSKATDGWHAAWGGATSAASAHKGYFNSADWTGALSYWGASATSLSLAGGLIKLSDLQRGIIDHAMTLVLPQTRARQWSWPAQRTDTSGGDTALNSIPAGSHFRLDPSLDLSKLSLPPVTRMIAVAAQRYGFYVTERTNWMVGLAVESPMPYVGSTGANPYTSYFGGKSPNQILGAFPWSRLQLLRMALSPAPR
jgi:hypothetical protein